MEKVKKLLLENLHLKILAIIIAFLLWLNLNIVEKTQFELVIPVKIVNVPENLAVEKYYPDVITVYIEGKRLNQFRFSTIKAICDASNIKEGINKLPVVIQKPEKEKITIKKFFPKYITVYAVRKSKQ